MMPPDQHEKLTGDEAPISPAAYSPPSVTVERARRPAWREILIAGALGAALVFLWFLSGVRAVELYPVPDTASVDISGGLELRLGGRVLLRPGEYSARAGAPGYEDAEIRFTVGQDAGQRLDITLVPLPGRLRIGTVPVNASVIIDGAEAGQSNTEPLTVAAGEHTLRLEAPRYRPLEQSISVEGRGIEQKLDVELAPAFGRYALVTEPPGATIFVDGTPVGTTPAQIELDEGLRSLRLTLEGYRDAALTVESRAGEQRDLDAIALQKADARIRIRTKPDGATITMDGVFQGRAPLELALESGERHELIAFKTGYGNASRSFTAARGDSEIVLSLQALTGELDLVVEPRDAEVLVAGRRVSIGSKRLQLPATQQQITIRREGYTAQQVTPTPRPGFAQRIVVRLEKATAPGAMPKAAIAQRMQSAAGQELVLLTPSPFYMGSSRREPGRRANELLREVKPRRPFYLGTNEVTNAEFRQFRSAHSSGNFKGKSLNGDTQPAVNIAWNDAALYCNWLSKREGLKPFYRLSGSQVIGVDSTSTGYRLPTEAEWAWAGTLGKDGKPMRFPWGENLPPPPGAGNYADKSGAGLLGAVIAAYDDGFAVSAPVRRFAADRHGLFDIGGNVAEWVHDLYEASSAGPAVDDPLGPDIGEFHVVRGASWRHGGLTELRLAFRDYGKEGRADLGFRIARYAR